MLDEKIADARMKEILGMGLPQISGSADLNYYIEKPTALVPGSNFGRPDLEYVPFQFNLAYNGQAGVNVSQLLFDGSYIIGVKAAQTFEQLARKQTNQTKIDVAVGVSKAYYGVLVGDARLELLNSNIDRLQKTFEDTKAMHDQGFVEQIDVDRLEIALNNLKTEREKAERLTSLSIYVLKFQMGMSQNGQLQLTDKLSDINAPESALLPDSIDYNKRIEMEIIKTQRQLQEYNIKRYKARYLPSFFGYYGLGTTANSEDPVILQKDQRWYWNSIVGVKATFTIFDGTQRYNKIKQESLTLNKIDNGIETLQQGLLLEYNSAKQTYTNALAGFKIQKRNKELAQEIVRVTKIKYNEGVGTNLELVDAESRLREAESNYFTAAYEAILAKIDLDKALGNIK